MATLGSELVAGIIIDALSDVTAVTDAVSSRMFSTTFVPQGQQLPALLTYAENSVYSGPIGAEINAEQLRVVVRLICQGTSTAPIIDAWDAQIDALNGLVVQQDGAYVTFTASGAVPLTTLQDGGTTFRQLGTVYNVEITTGG